MARKKEPELITINQDRIAKKAKELFRINGYEATRMEEIAKEVDMSKTTLYVYFKNKDEIKNYLSLQAVNAFYEELFLIKRFQKENLHDSYMQICNTLVKLKEDYPDEFDMIVQNICVDQEMLKRDAVLRQIFETGEAINQIVFSFFENFIQESEEGRRTIFFQWGSIFGIITLAYNKEEYIRQQMHMTKEEFMQRGFENLFESLRKQEGDKNNYE